MKTGLGKIFTVFHLSRSLNNTIWEKTVPILLISWHARKFNYDTMNVERKINKQIIETESVFPLIS